MESVDDLRALGYAGAGEALPEAATVGVQVHDRARVAPGVNLITHSLSCRTELVDMEGVVHHAWTDPAGDRWDNTVLLPDGDLLVVGRDSTTSTFAGELSASYLMRLAWDGTPRWRTSAPVHHDAELAPDGSLLALTAELEPIAAVDPEHPTYDHALTRFSATGERLDSLSLYELFHAAPGFHFQPVAARKKNQHVAVDLFHSNSVESLRGSNLAGAGPLYRAGNLLLCLRHQDTLAIVDPTERRVLWTFGQGILSGPHDATWLANGHVLAFDNGLERGWSRVLELDPASATIVWEYEAEPRASFFSLTRGAAQRLTNGNTLITHSHGGRVFEVTPDKMTVWLYQTPHLTAKREPSILVRTRRLEGLDWAEVERRVQEGTPLPLTD